MSLTSRKTFLLLLGIASLVCSRAVFWFINDPEGPNLLIVTVLAAIIFAVSLGVYALSSIKTVRLMVAIVVCELAGGIGSLFTTPSIGSWYATLARPALSPPNWVFGPVWTTLFVLMGIAAFLVWEKGRGRKGVKIALGIFTMQLVLNTLWSIIFFGLHSIAGAAVEIVILWLAILATIVAFAKVSRPAAWLLAPYLAWVAFAAYLNLMIWLLN